jgi:hypothetical protein
LTLRITISIKTRAFLRTTGNWGTWEYMVGVGISAPRA